MRHASLHSADPGQIVAEITLAAAPQVFAQLAQDSEFGTSVHGQTALVDLLVLLIDTIDAADPESARQCIFACPPTVCATARDMLLAAYFPDRPFDIAALNDAAMLCLVLLTAASGGTTEARALLDEAAGDARGAAFGIEANRLRSALFPNDRFEAKLIIWDLDDTLWSGTLAEGDAVELNRTRADLIRSFNQHGLVSSLCSKNDPATARAALERFGLWDAFVFPRIAFAPKGEAVKQLIADMRLRPANVLFVDDNPHNLHEVAAAVPGIRIVDATSPDCDALLHRILDESRHVTKSRVAEYRALQAKIDDRAQSLLSNATFLQNSGIQAVVTRWMDNLDFVERIEELINRSNQLNYTGSRIAEGSLAEQIMDIRHHDTRCIFVWDKYGDYGLVGFAMVDPATSMLRHFVFSCRIMHMGIEHFLLDKLGERYALDLGMLCKPLPERGENAIAEASFLEPKIRERILARAAARDRAHVRLRLMCDCQSGGILHYSRFAGEAEFDNMPRLFSLPMMLGDAWHDQFYPSRLVYTPATDYLDWRWSDTGGVFDDTVYADCAERFCHFVATSGRKLLVLLPPTDAADDKYAPLVHPSRTFVRGRGITFNAIWEAMAAKYPTKIECVRLSGILPQSELLDANHYLPRALQRMAGVVDNWYAR